MNIAPFEKDNGKVARLIPYLYLYRFGYDFRRFLVLEEYWRSDLVSLRQATQNVKLTRNLTVWLEYFASSLLAQLNNTYDNVTSGKILTNVRMSTFSLNTRQEQILNILTEPGMQITNMQVQRKFKISQVTASRDLAKLVRLELVLSHGKGRSVFYTKL
jgi:Fic family protein